MFWLVIVSLVLGFAAMMSFLVKYNRKRTLIGVFNKMIVSLFFIFTAFFSILDNLDNVSTVRYGLLLLMGMIFGLLGDIYLDQKWIYPEHDGKYLYAGFLVFLVGHVFYVCAMYTKIAAYGFKPIHFLYAALIAIVVDVCNLAMEKPTKQNYGSYRPIVIIYTFFVGCTPGMAIVSMFVSHFEPAFIMMSVAGALFLLSDIILSPMYFGKDRNTPVNFVINHVTYWLAQYLIALSIFFIK